MHFRKILFISAIFSASPAFAFAFAATLSVSPATGSATVGSTLTVQIQVNTQGAASDGVDVRYLNFNPSLLQVIDENSSVSGVQITPGMLMPNTPVNTVDNTMGRITFSQVPSGGTMFTNASSQTLATVRFQVLAAGTAALTLNHTLGSTADCNVAQGGSDILTSVTNGSYTLNTASDTTPPTVSITSPSAGTTVSNTVTLSANATDNVAVASVEFFVDGTSRGTDTSSPYSIQWDTTNGGTHPCNGAHTHSLTARATDSSGNTTTSAAVTVNMNNPSYCSTSTKFSLNDRVQVSGTGGSGLNVRSCAGTSCSILGTQAEGNQGTIIGGPTTADGFNWWNVNYDAGVDGWSVEDFLTKVTTTSDTQAPSIPSNLSAAAISSSQINLSWTASTDNIGVTGYRVERCQGSSCTNFTQIAIPSGTSYSDTGLTANTTYRYRVRATDAAGNLSGYSSIASATTQSTSTDTTPPAVSITAPSAGTTVSNTVTLSANATDNVAVASVEFFVDGTSRGTDTSSPYSIQWDTTNGGTHPCNGAHTHSLTARATDSSGNTTTSAAVTVNMNNPSYCPVPDTTPPTLSNIASSNVTTSGATITWNTNEPSDSQVEYGVTTIYGNMSPLNSTLGTSHTATLSNLSPSTTYNYRVRSKDAAGNLAVSLNRTFTTQALPDTTPPAAVVDFAASNITANAATLAWSAPADLPGGGAAASYDIRYSMSIITELNFASATAVTGEPAPSTPGTTQNYILAGLNPSTTYYAAIRSSDSAGNTSLVSNIVSFATQAAADTTAPTAPANLMAASVSTSRIDLTWSASSDSVGVTGYRVERCQGSTCANFAQIAAPTVTNYADTGLAVNTTYRYRVRAVDGAGNLSAYSNIASAATTDTIAPSVSITSPAADATVAGTIAVSATATDNVGVVGVQFRLDGANLGAEDTTAPYSISWNTAGVADGSHILTARARDAAGNITTSSGVTMNVLNNPPPAFDFSLSNEGAKNAAQGGSAANTITATRVAGTAESVAFSATGFPSGAAGTFLPTSCTPGCSTTLTISVGASTPVGKYQITVSGTSGSLIKTTSFELTITPPPSKKFKNNDRVKVVPSSKANSAPVYSSASISSTRLTVQPDGTLGTIVGGPVHVDGAHWWQVDYNTSGGIGSDIDGWSIEDALELATFATGAKFVPSVEGNTVSTRNFTVNIVERTSSTTLFIITTQPDQEEKLPLSTVESNLLEGTYNLLVEAAAYLRSFVRDVVISANTAIALPKLRGGDFNNDGIINSFDWSYMNSNNRWLSSDSLADLNGDGVVNTIDYSFLNKNWGKFGD